MSHPSQSTTNERLDALPPASTSDALRGPRADLARVIPRRPRVSWGLGIALAVGFAILVMPAITAERWLSTIGVGKIVRDEPAPITVRVSPFAGYDTAYGHIGGGGVLIARGEIATSDQAIDAEDIDAAVPHGPVPYIAYLLLVGVLAGLFTHHTRRSTYGRLLRVQLVSLGWIVATAIVVKLLMLTTALSVLVVPVAVFAMVPTIALDRVVGLATGTLAALVVAFLVPFDAGVAVMLMVQAGAAGLVVAERPKKRVRAALVAGAVATLFTAATYPLMLYLSAGRLPLAELSDPLHSAWFAAAVGSALAVALSIVLVPIYQLLVGEITHGKLVELEELSHPLLKQISDKAPGTWQHSLTMANMAEIAANAIGANGRLVRVGAYFHDLGKSLNPKYFIENLEPGETSPHDKLPPEVSCDAIFKHVTEGIVAARKAGLHERIIDFMHMHHGNGVLEYFWARCREQGNPRTLTVEHFRYPGVPPQSRETAILSICDAVEAAARTLKKPDVSAIDNLVQRIVYGKLHLGQLDESGLSMGDLRRISESLRETIRHANHGRIEYPWQKAQQDASASKDPDKLTQTGPRLDSLDRPARPDTVSAPTTRASAEALAETDSAGVTPNLRPQAGESNELAMLTTAPVPRSEVPLLLSGPLPTDHDETRPAPKQDLDDIVELKPSRPKLDPRDSDARLKRATNPVEPRRTAPEVAQFTDEAQQALADASRDLAPAPRDSALTVPVSRDSEPTIDSALPTGVQRAPAEPELAITIEASEPPPRQKASTLPPIKPPTAPPPLGRRAPTVPPPANLTVPPPAALRPPAPASAPPPNVTVPPPSTVRPPGMNYLDDMITLRPQYEPRPELVVQESEDGSVLIEPAKPRATDDTSSTQPRMLKDDVGDATDPNVTLRDHDARAGAESSWARGLAARLDAQLEEDFGTETPVSAPTKADLQALLDSPLDPTRQQSLDEIERLHRESRDRPSGELDFTRRAPHPTAEVDDADIEAAIELAPPARKSAIGVAKKKRED